MAQRSVVDSARGERSVSLGAWRCTRESRSTSRVPGDINPVYVQEVSCEIPRFRIAPRGVDPRTALQVVRDELMLDGNARLNLATFVTTWMEPEAER